MAICHLVRGKMSKDELNEKFVELSKKLGLNNLEVSRLLGVHQRTYYRWASGDTSVPYSVIKVLELLCEQKEAKVTE
jgi:hypothetical protein